MIVLQAIAILIIASGPLMLALSDHERLRAEDEYWYRKVLEWESEYIFDY